MPPIDSAPEGAEVLHQQQEPTFPEPKPGEESDEPVRGQPGAARPDAEQRPSLPAQTEPLATDLEDEDADPVVDNGPGISDGVSSLSRQRG